MEFNEYARLLQEVESMVATGRLKEAETALYQLMLRDISDLDKALLCVRMAEIFDRSRNSDDALEWYEKGIAYEQIYGRFEITEKKAEYLSSLGRSKEAIALYEPLIRQPYLTEKEKDRMRKMIQALLGKAMRETRQ